MKRKLKFLLLSFSLKSGALPSFFHIFSTRRKIFHELFILSLTIFHILNYKEFLIIFYLIISTGSRDFIHFKSIEKNIIVWPPIVNIMGEQRMKRNKSQNKKARTTVCWSLKCIYMMFITKNSYTYIYIYLEASSRRQTPTMAV